MVLLSLSLFFSHSQGSTMSVCFFVHSFRLFHLVDILQISVVYLFQAKCVVQSVSKLQPNRQLPRLRKPHKTKVGLHPSQCPAALELMACPLVFLPSHRWNHGAPVKRISVILSKSRRNSQGDPCFRLGRVRGTQKDAKKDGSGFDSPETEEIHGQNCQP